MKREYLRTSLAAAVWLLCAQLGFVVPQDGSAPSTEAQTIPTAPPSSYPDAPSLVKRSPTHSPGKAQYSGPPPAATGGWNPALDAKFGIATGMMFVASIVNVEKTNACLQQHTCSFVPVAFRSRAALYGAGIPAEVGVAYLSYRLKDHRHRWWFIPVAAVTAANAYVAYHSAHEPSHSGASK